MEEKELISRLETMKRRLFCDNLVTKAVEKSELVDGKQQAVFTEEELEDIDCECLTPLLEAVQGINLLKAVQATNSLEGYVESVKLENKRVTKHRNVSMLF